MQLDSQLRVIGVTEQAINRLLPAIGKLNAVSKIEDPRRFVQNLGQLATTGFQTRDLRELVNASPLASQVIKQTFKVDSAIDGEKIKKQAEALGLTSADAFFTAFAAAAGQNQALNSITESIGTRLEKLQDRVEIALRPLGVAILDALAPAIEKGVEIVEKLSKAFESIPDGLKSAIVGFGILAVAIGPVVAGAGAFIQAFGALGNLVGVAKSLQAVVAALEATAVAEAAAGEAAVVAGAASTAAFGPLLPIVLAVAAAVGVAAVVWATYETAAERAAKVTTDSVASQLKQVDSLNQLQQKAGEAADGHKKLTDVLAQLDPGTRTYIESINDEKLASQELNRVLAEQIKLKAASLSQNLGDVGTASSQLTDQAAQAQRRLNELQQRQAEFARNSGAAPSSVYFVPQGAIQSAQQYGDAINKTKAEIEGARNAQVQFGSVIAAVFQANRQLTVEGFVAQQIALGRTRDEVNGMVTAYDAFIANQAKAQKAAGGTTDALSEQAREANRLQVILKDLFAGDTKSANDLIQDKIKAIAGQAKTTAQALKDLRQIRKTDQGFDLTINEKTQVEKNLKALNDAISPTQKHSGTRGATSDNGENALRDARIALAEAEANKLLQIEKGTIQEQQRVIDAGFQDNLISIKSYYTERRALAEREGALDIQRQEKIVRDQQEKVRQIAASLPGLLGKTKTTAQRESVNNKAETETDQATTKIIQAQTQIAEISARTRAAIEGDSRAQVQAFKELGNVVFDVRKQFLELSGKGFLATIEEDAKRTGQEVLKLVANGKILVALQAVQNFTTRSDRTRAAGIGEQVANRRNDADLERLKIQNDLVLGVIGEGQAQERTLAVDQKLRESIALRLQFQLLFTRGNEAGTIEIKKQIEALRTLGKDAQALRESCAQKGFLNDAAFVNTAQTQAKDARLSEQENTAKQIIKLQDEIAHSAEGSADRARLAWLQANREIQTANEKASEEFIANQVKLRHNLDVDPSRLNDGVVKLLAEQKSLQQTDPCSLIAKLQVSFLKAVTDAVESSANKMTPIFGDEIVAAGKAFYEQIMLLFPSDPGGISTDADGNIPDDIEDFVFPDELEF